MTSCADFLFMLFECNSATRHQIFLLTIWSWWSCWDIGCKRPISRYHHTLNVFKENNMTHLQVWWYEISIHRWTLYIRFLFSKAWNSTVKMNAVAAVYTCVWDGAAWCGRPGSDPYVMKYITSIVTELCSMARPMPGFKTLRPILLGETWFHFVHGGTEVSSSYVT